MNVRNCRKCGAIFNYVMGPIMCPACRDALEAKNYTISDSTLGPVATTTAEVTDPEAIAQLEKMLDMMDENEDIQEVFHNWNG